MRSINAWPVASAASSAGSSHCSTKRPRLELHCGAQELPVPCSLKEEVQQGAWGHGLAPGLALSEAAEAAEAES